MDCRYGHSERPELLSYIPSSAHVLLDVGCGVGAFGRSLRSERPDIESWAVEPDPVSAKMARDHYDHIIVASFPNGQIPDAKFDVVVCGDVLEHMAEPEKALIAASQALNENGIMVASIPNVRNWRSVVWPLIRYGTWTYENLGILDRTHLRFFTSRSMRDFFIDNGWTVQSMSGIKSLSRRDNLFTTVTAHRLDDFLFPQYIVVARPKRAILIIPACEDSR